MEIDKEFINQVLNYKKNETEKKELSQRIDKISTLLIDPEHECLRNELEPIQKRYMKTLSDLSIEEHDILSAPGIRIREIIDNLQKDIVHWNQLKDTHAIAQSILNAHIAINQPIEGTSYHLIDIFEMCQNLMPHNKNTILNPLAQYFKGK